MPAKTAQPKLLKIHIRSQQDLWDVMNQLSNGHYAAVTVQDETGIQRPFRINKTTGLPEYFYKGKWNSTSSPSSSQSSESGSSSAISVGSGSADEIIGTGLTLSPTEYAELQVILSENVNQFGLTAISPAAGTYKLLKVQYAQTLVSIVGQTDQGNVVGQLQLLDDTGANPVNSQAADTTFTDAETAVASFSNGVLSAGCSWALKITSVSGTPGQFNLTVYYTD